MKKILLYTFLFCLVFSAIAGEVPTWEESTPVPVPTWEESTPIENRLYSPTKKNFQALRNAFGGDPLSFIDDPQIKADLDFATEGMENPETERKKWALAAYFAQMGIDEIQFCHANMDTLLEQFYGKKISVDEAYNDIAVAFGLRERDKYFFYREYEKELQISCICVAFLFVLLILLLIRKIICRVFRMCRNLLLVFFSKENYFKTCILIFGFIITACMVIIAAHFL